MTWGVDQVSVRFRTTLALDSVSVALEPSKVVAVVGGDGAGKTTLARVLAGLVRPTSGVVRRPDSNQTGYQSEASGVWRDLTTAENLDFVGSAHRFTSQDRNARINEMLSITQLGSARDRLAGNLSGGMRQKLGVAMAMFPKPRLLILDEPTTGLDPVSRTDLWTLIARAAADGAAVLVTTAYLDEAGRGDTILALDQGRTLAQGTVDEVRRSTPGAVGRVDPRNHPRAWRRGHDWRAWFPDGVLPPDATGIEPDLSDLITVAALARRQNR